ncbi:MAG: hypothetical protein V1715_07580 [bacterium]
MAKYLCLNCHQIYEEPQNGKCPHCQHPALTERLGFSNSDEFLRKETPKIVNVRKALGLEGLVDSLEAVIINTEPENQKAAAEELLRYTGYDFKDSFEDDEYKTCLLCCPKSADLLIRSRIKPDNPFVPFNAGPKSSHMPNTRLETFIYSCKDLQKYVQIQKMRGVEFMTPEIQQYRDYIFIQTMPSKYTGNSLGFIQWKKPNGSWRGKAKPLKWNLKKPKHAYLKKIGTLDHCATRIKALDRDAAIVEFMYLTNYHFDFAIYVKSQNSITTVARLSHKDYAQVFTSGIAPYKNETESGPTEKFIHNFNLRVHHMAFVTKDIEATFKALGDDGLEYLLELVGCEDDGLKQTFTAASPNTLLVNEYIHRYGDFDGFFTKRNVTLLTEATDKQ